MIIQINKGRKKEEKGEKLYKEKQNKKYYRYRYRYMFIIVQYDF